MQAHGCQRSIGEGHAGTRISEKYQWRSCRHTDVREVSVKVMQAHGCQKGIPVLLTSAMQRKGVVNATPWPLYPRKEDPVPTPHEAGWAPQPVWMSVERSKSCAPPGFETQTVQPATSLYPGSLFNSKRLYIRLPTPQTVKLIGFRRKDRDSILDKGTIFFFSSSHRQ